jgi:hypothetical protein
VDGSIEEDDQSLASESHKLVMTKVRRKFSGSNILCRGSCRRECAVLRD